MEDVTSRRHLVGYRCSAPGSTLVWRDTQDPSKRFTHGPGIYFTTDPDYAERYCLPDSDRHKVRIEGLLLPSSSFIFAHPDFIPPDPEVKRLADLPEYRQLLATLDWTPRWNVATALAELVDFLGVDRFLATMRRIGVVGTFGKSGNLPLEFAVFDDKAIRPEADRAVSMSKNRRSRRNPSPLDNPPKLYHGSNEDWLEELDGNDPGYTGSLGWGLYLTTDPDFAAKFGKHIYEVESPVPDELVAQIEPMSYDCGNDLTFYTPGSTPFTFEIEDRKTGKTHRYSVLGDCDEQVRDELRRSVLEEFTPSQELKDDVSKLPPAIAARVGVGAQEILDAAINGERIDDHVIEAFLSTMVEEKEEKEGEADADFLSLLDNEVQPLLEALEREIDEFADAKVAERLGDEIDLDDISKQVEHHGYSAFFIEGYAPGNEYVIVDEKYLPIPVTR